MAKELRIHSGSKAHLVREFMKDNPHLNRHQVHAVLAKFGVTKGNISDTINFDKRREMQAAKTLPVDFVSTPEEEEAFAAMANTTQVGGQHYKSKAIQPWDYIASNNMGYLEGNVVKYVSRWKDKGGVEDLKKAQHYLTKLIEVNQ